MATKHVTDSFFDITLTSDGFQSLFPKNTISFFRAKLPAKLVLPSNIPYKVALHKLTFTNAINNIGEGVNTKLWVTDNLAQIKNIPLPEACVDDIDEFTSVLNNQIKKTVPELVSASVQASGNEQTSRQDKKGTTSSDSPRQTSSGISGNIGMIVDLLADDPDAAPPQPPPPLKPTIENDFKIALDLRQNLFPILFNENIPIIQRTLEIIKQYMFITSRLTRLDEHKETWEKTFSEPFPYNEILRDIGFIKYLYQGRIQLILQNDLFDESSQRFLTKLEKRIVEQKREMGPELFTQFHKPLDKTIIVEPSGLLFESVREILETFEDCYTKLDENTEEEHDLKLLSLYDMVLEIKDIQNELEAQYNDFRNIAKISRILNVIYNASKAAYETQAVLTFISTHYKSLLDRFENAEKHLGEQRKRPDLIISNPQTNKQFSSVDEFDKYLEMVRTRHNDSSRRLKKEFAKFFQDGYRKYLKKRKNGDITDTTPNDQLTGDEIHYRGYERRLNQIRTDFENDPSEEKTSIMRRFKTFRGPTRLSKFFGESSNIGKAMLPDDDSLEDALKRDTAPSPPKMQKRDPPTTSSSVPQRSQTVVTSQPISVPTTTTSQSESDTAPSPPKMQKRDPPTTSSSVSQSSQIVAPSAAVSNIKTTLNMDVDGSLNISKSRPPRASFVSLGTFHPAGKQYKAPTDDDIKRYKDEKKRREENNNLFQEWLEERKKRLKEEDLEKQREREYQLWLEDNPDKFNEEVNAISKEEFDQIDTFYKEIPVSSAERESEEIETTNELPHDLSIITKTIAKASETEEKQKPAGQPSTSKPYYDHAREPWDSDFSSTFFQNADTETKAHFVLAQIPRALSEDASHVEDTNKLILNQVNLEYRPFLKPYFERYNIPYPTTLHDHYYYLFTVNKRLKQQQAFSVFFAYTRLKHLKNVLATVAEGTKLNWDSDRHITMNELQKTKTFSTLMETFAHNIIIKSTCVDFDFGVSEELFDMLGFKTQNQHLERSFFERCFARNYLLNLKRDAWQMKTNAYSLANFYIRNENVRFTNNENWDVKVDQGTNTKSSDLCSGATIFVFRKYFMNQLELHDSNAIIYKQYLNFIKNELKITDLALGLTTFRRLLLRALTPSENAPRSLSLIKKHFLTYLKTFYRKDEIFMLFANSLSEADFIYPLLDIDLITFHLWICAREMPLFAPIVASIPPRLNPMSQVWIYTNIIKETIVNDSYKKLLAMGTTNTTKNTPKGGEHEITFREPLYKHLNVSVIDEIEILIATRFGNPVPFVGGPSTVVLCFEAVN